jgi:hypothetical protein
MFVERKIVLSTRKRTRIILYILTMLTATQCIWIGINTRCFSTTNFHRLVPFREQSKNHIVNCVDKIRSFKKHSQNFEKRLLTSRGVRGSTAVKVLCYKSEGHWFDSRWCHWIFPLTQFFRSHYGPGVDSASNRNEYQEYFLGVNAAGA